MRSSILITGASSGIGRATAIHLADAGFRVFAGDPPGGTAADFEGREVEEVALDVTDGDSVAAAAAQIGSAVGPAGLQGLVNNAGIGAMGPLEYLSLDQVRRIFDVNVFGALAVTQALLPAIREGSGRIVMIASVVAHLPLPFGSPVSASKAALESFSDSLRRELHSWEIPVVQVEPGSIHTPAVAKLKSDVRAALEAMPAEAQDRYRAPIEALMTKQMGREEAGSDPAVVAAAVEQALTAKRPKHRYPVGADAHLMLGVSRIPEPLRDDVLYRVFGLGPGGETESG
jgi:NAD(P)-dependent dehydrogenase (short-subunit alcohol dehydrogenase family)